MDIPSNTVKRFCDETFLYGSSTERIRGLYNVNKKPYKMYFNGAYMLISLRIVYDTLKSFISNFGMIQWAADIQEVQIKKDKFAVYNRGIYIYGYNSLVPIFVYDRNEILVAPIVFYDNKSTLYFMIRKYVIHYILTKVNMDITIKLLKDEVSKKFTLTSVKRSTENYVQLLNKLNISLDAEKLITEQKKEMTQTTTPNNNAHDDIPF